MALAEAGHNNPPTDLNAWLREELTERHAPIVRRAEELHAAFERAPAEITDEDTSGKVSDFIKQISAAVKDAEANRVQEKEPHLARSRVVDGFFKAITDPLEAQMRALRERLTAHLRRKEAEERQRREAEAARAAEEARKATAAAVAAEANARDDASLSTAIDAEQQAETAQADAIIAAQAASAKPAELSRVRGDFGAVSSLRRVWTFEVTDRKALDLVTLRPYLAATDVDKAIRAAIKAGVRDLAGCRIFETTNATVR